MDKASFGSLVAAIPAPLGVGYTGACRRPAVYDNRDNKIGDVNDLLLDKDGKINAVIIGVGGFLGVGEKNVAVPFSSLKVAEKDGSRYLVLETTKEARQGAPSYIYDSNKKVWMPATKQG